MTPTPLQQLALAVRQNGLVRFIDHYAALFPKAHLKDVIVDEIGADRAITIAGRRVINFGSDSFLGLDQDHRVQEALIRGTKKWGTHNGASRAFASVRANAEAEDKLARWLGTEAALIYPSVTLAHVGGLPGRVGRHELHVVGVRPYVLVVVLRVRVAHEQPAVAVAELHEGETVLDAARRELCEELDLDVDHRGTMTAAKGELGICYVAMVSVAAGFSIRNLPSMAVVGWPLIFWYVVGTALFLLPLALTAAELASAWPKAGGVFAWVAEAFGERSGFMAVWSIFVVNVPWYPTVLAFVALSLAYGFDPAWQDNRWYVAGTMIVLFWGVTLACLAGPVAAAKFTSLGTLLGNVVPAAILIAASSNNILKAFYAAFFAGGRATAASARPRSR